MNKPETLQESDLLNDLQQSDSSEQEPWEVGLYSDAVEEELTEQPPINSTPQ